MDEKGQQKTINTTGCRIRLNLILAMNLNYFENIFLFHIDKASFGRIRQCIDNLPAHLWHNYSCHLDLVDKSDSKEKLANSEGSALSAEVHPLIPCSSILTTIQQLGKVMNEQNIIICNLASKKSIWKRFDNFLELTLSKIVGN